MFHTSQTVVSTDPALAATVQLAGERGWHRVTADEVARRAGLPRSVVRRRWADRTAMATEVVQAAVLLPAPEDRGSLAADLAAVAAGLAAPLSADEAAVAGLHGDRQWCPTLSAAVAGVVDQAPRVLLEVLAVRAVARGEHAVVTGRALRTVRALLAHRLATGPLVAQDLRHLVDDVLLPALVDPRLSRV